MDSYFGIDSVLARRLTRFEPRTGQLRMAQAVHDLLRQEDLAGSAVPGQPDCLVVEAETGLGKTLAYLIPAVLSGRRVAVSTNTKNLQDQILEQEIPFIRRHIEPTLTATCVKGRQNYLCLYRFHQIHSDRQNVLFDRAAITRIAHWLDTTTFADRSELDWLESSSPLWQKICCQSHFCLGQDCPDSAACFLNRLRREAAASQLLVVNHHLLFSDLAVRRGGHGEVLPRYEAVIFDEAHHVEQVATSFFGHSFSRYQALDLAGDVERAALAGLAHDSGKNLARTAHLLAGLVDQMAALFPQQRGRFPLPEILEHHPQLEQCRDSITGILEEMGDQLGNLEGHGSEWMQYRLRADDLATRLRLITSARFDDLPREEVRFIHWYERSEKNFTLAASPIDVAESLRETLFHEVAAVLFTSATISAGGDFTYFFSRIGLEESTPALSLPSPFDYQRQTRLYIPADGFPEPAHPQAATAMHEEMAKLLRLAEGRALLLFTATAAMERARLALQDMVPFPLLVQGSAPRHTLLRQFIEEKQSVLLGVASFWEGVDVPGDSLSLVIIDKLPFEVPSDPVIMARIERIRSQGGNPFHDYQIPQAIIALRQGFGRLMRRGSDHGVVGILDIRLFSKGYGKRFLRSLPPSPVCRSLDEVQCFFQATGQEISHSQDKDAP